MFLDVVRALRNAVQVKNYLSFATEVFLLHTATTPTRSGGERK